MGVLTASGKMADYTDAPEPAGTEPEPPEAPEEQPPSPEPQEKAEFVPFSRLEKKPGSRRERAERMMEETLNQRLKPLEETISKERQEFQNRLQQYEERIARLTGSLETMQKFPQNQPQTPKGPDPEDLHRRAQEQLDAGRFDEYERLKRQALLTEAEQRIEARLSTFQQEIQQRIPQPMDPFLQTMFARHQNVAMAGERGAKAVQVKDQELELYGMPRGPERLQKAFELADKFLASRSQPSPPAYSRDAASSLAGLPTGRPAASGGGDSEPGHALTPLQRQAAKNAGMSVDDYVKWMYPEKFVNKR